MKQLLLNSITSLVSAFPNLHRPLYQPLQNLALEFMDAHARSAVPPPNGIVWHAAELLALLPNTSGKVKSAELWRKSVDDSLAVCWIAFRSIRTTYTIRGKGYFLSTLLQLINILTQSSLVFMVKVPQNPISMYGNHCAFWKMV